MVTDICARHLWKVKWQTHEKHTDQLFLSLKLGDRNAKRTEKHKDETLGKTLMETQCRKKVCLSGYKFDQNWPAKAAIFKLCDVTQPLLNVVGIGIWYTCIALLYKPAFIAT